MTGDRSEGSFKLNEMPRRTVLAVDDSHDSRAILGLLLTKLGHEAREAEDAETGMAISREFRPEVVLCDIMMPGEMSGYAFARAVRQQTPLHDLCMVAVSGWEGPDHEKRAYEAGFDRILKKPVELTDLATILRTLPRRAGEPLPS